MCQWEKKRNSRIRIKCGEIDESWQHRRVTPETSKEMKLLDLSRVRKMHYSFSKTSKIGNSSDKYQHSLTDRAKRRAKSLREKRRF